VEDKIKEQVAKGAKIEGEHANTIMSLIKEVNPDFPKDKTDELVKRIKEELAKDHVVKENMPNYYDELEQLEKKLKGGEANSAAMSEPGNMTVRDDTQNDSHSTPFDTKKPDTISTKPVATGDDPEPYNAKNVPPQYGSNDTQTFAHNSALKINASAYLPTDSDMRKVVILNDNGSGRYTVRDLINNTTFIVSSDELLSEEEYKNTNFF